jgi:Predicted metal-dependent enzyme
MKPSGIGGQAVIEGVMMKNQNEYAIAVRKPNNEIIVKKDSYQSITEKYKILKLPIFRGVVAFIESMVIGTKTLTYSASFFEEEEKVEPTKMEQTFSKIFKDKAESVVMGLTILLSIVLAVGIFMILPLFAAEVFQKITPSTTILAIIEGIIRITIFVAYVLAISQMKDIKRVFMYHGAEHKTINCLENGLELNVKNVRRQSKHHKRCGTSFMLIVMFVSIIFFIFIRVDVLWLRMVIRILLVPVIAGVSYEFIKLAGRSESKIVTILSKPGMWLQALTTKEPDDSMIEVAIQSVEAVFDWKGYLGVGEKSGKKSKKNNKNKKQVAAVKKTEAEADTETAVTENYDLKKEVVMEKKTDISSLINEEEDDEILNALDKYFIYKEDENTK